MKELWNISGLRPKAKTILYGQGYSALSISRPGGVLRIMQPFSYLPGGFTQWKEWGSAQSTAANLPLSYSTQSHWPGQYGYYNCHLWPGEVISELLQTGWIFSRE